MIKVIFDIFAILILTFCLINFYRTKRFPCLATKLIVWGIAVSMVMSCLTILRYTVLTEDWCPFFVRMIVTYTLSFFSLVFPLWSAWLIMSVADYSLNVSLKNRWYTFVPFAIAFVILLTTQVTRAIFWFEVDGSLVYSKSNWVTSTALTLVYTAFSVVFAVVHRKKYEKKIVILCLGSQILFPLATALTLVAPTFTYMGLFRAIYVVCVFYAFFYNTSISDKNTGHLNQQSLQRYLANRFSHNEKISVVEFEIATADGLTERVKYEKIKKMLNAVDKCVGQNAFVFFVSERSFVVVARIGATEEIVRRVNNLLPSFRTADWKYVKAVVLKQPDIFNDKASLEKAGSYFFHFLDWCENFTLVVPDRSVISDFEQATEVENAIFNALAEETVELRFAPHKCLRTESYIIGTDVLLHDSFSGYYRSDVVCAAATNFGMASQLSLAMLKKAAEFWVDYVHSGKVSADKISLWLPDFVFADQCFASNALEIVESFNSTSDAFVLYVTPRQLRSKRCAECLKACAALGFCFFTDVYAPAPFGDNKITFDFLVASIPEISAAMSSKTLEGKLSECVEQAHKNGCRVFAVGLDSASQVKFAKSLGFDAYGGYVVSEYMDKSDYLLWLSKRQADE